jgi:hypothetical protein
MYPDHPIKGEIERFGREGERGISVENGDKGGKGNVGKGGV